jgi:Carboxypeptidase regulatory-like domain/TonB dependent receptor
MRVRTLLVFFLVLLTAATLTAQTFRGMVLGTVTDPSGAVVAGAKVVVKSADTGQERTTTTSADGSYTIPELQIGTYTVTITQSGFQTYITTGVTVDVAVQRRVDAQLKAGEVSQTVEVSGESLPQIETTSNTLGGVFTTTEVKDIPVNGRDYQKLIYLTPGIAGSPDQITDSPGSFGVFSMNGARGRSNNFLLDGTDMNDGYRNDPAINEAGVFGTPATILPIDAVAELRVLSNFEPEYGRNAGAVINIVTKSGTNQLHGSAIEYFRNSALDARNFFNFASQPKAQFHNNQFGGSLGGAIIKDKTFFYVDYEGQREKVGVVTLANVPTGTAPDGSLDPSQASNPVIASLLALHPWPAPNVANGQGFNASITSPSSNRVDSMIAKIDHNFNASNTLTGRYYFGDSDQSFPLALTASGGQLPGFNTVTPTRVQLVSLSYVRTIGANKVNELRYGWNRFAEQFNPQDSAFHPSSIGLNTGTGVADNGLPIILVSGVAQLGATSGDPRSRVDSNNQLLDNFSWKINKHEVKFGFEYRRTSVQHSFNKYFRGRLRFKDTTDANGNVIATALQNFLDGDVTDGFQYSGYSLRHTAENNYGLYVQDTFRLTPRLTVTYGMRYDYFGVVNEKNNLFSNITNLDPTNATFTLTQVGTGGLNQLYNSDKNNFAPRLSAAWDVRGTGKTVLRAGFGVFYDGVSQDAFLGHLPYAPFFGPGPAYNNAGPAPILSAGAVGGPIVSGQPVYGSTGGGCAYECDTFTFDRNIRTPYMENYNINLQQQLAPKMVLQIGYVGSQGHKLWRFRDLNQPSAAAINAADVACNCITDFSSDARPFRNNPYGAYYMLNEESSGQSNYNALQTSFRINQWKGVTSIMNYSWSHSIDNSSDLEDFEPNAAQPNDSTNPQLEKGNSNFDLRNRFTWIFGYELPTMGGSMQKLKNGWGLSSTVSLQSGQPFHFNYNFEDDYSGSGNAFDRPDVVGPITYHGGNPYNFIDLSSFAIPCTTTQSTGAASDCVIGTRHFGDQRRGSLVGPNYKQWDFALYKNTALTERLNMQLRAEFFNILNHPNFASPYLPAFIADPGFNGFQQVGNREVGVGGLPLSATGDVGVGNPFLGGGGPRGIQLAVKFTF